LRLADALLDRLEAPHGWYNVSEDPEVIVKMMILVFLDDVHSERELMRIIAERLDYMSEPLQAQSDALTVVKRCAFIPDWRIEEIHPAESSGKVNFY
jgi:hypothetical protein